jgi:3-hydroxyisobutyrate dehydrogenase-like beta-hydroxyacid dehydrogenase
MNLVIAGAWQALVEGFATARRAGVAPEEFFRVLDLNVARSGLSELKRPKLLARDWSPQFSVKHMRKDLRLALEMASGLGQDLPLTRDVERAYGRAVDLGLGDSDFAALLETLERGAGQEPVGDRLLGVEGGLCPPGQ